MKGNITQKELKRMLHYDPKTGVFTWAVDVGRRIKSGVIAGCKDSNGYIVITVNGERYKAHRLAWVYVNGYFPENCLDHINRVKHDNIFNNLREVSHQCNMRNREVPKNNKSGVTGVHWHKGHMRWRADITVNKEKITIGEFISKTEAIKARWKAEIKYEFPNCNTTSASYLYLKEKKII